VDISLLVLLGVPIVYFFFNPLKISAGVLPICSSLCDLLLFFKNLIAEISQAVCPVTGSQWFTESWMLA
jgi:hypothetical protein